MLKTMMFASLMAGFCLVSAWAETPMMFKSVTVELPIGDRIFPGGDKAEAINNNCLACHSAGMVLNQPALKKAEWSAEVRKMITVYKAPVSDADADAIIAYLVETKGTR